MATFSGTPAELLGSIFDGAQILAATSIGANSTTYTARTEGSPKLAKLVCDGNSLTLDYPPDLLTLLKASQASHPSKVWAVINSGLGSTTTDAMIASFAADVTPHYNPYLVNLLLYCELTNQIAAGGTLAATKASAINYCDAARAAGWKLAFVIPTPRASVTDSGYSSSLSAWSNAGEKSVYDDACTYFRNAPQHYDYLIDLPATASLNDPLDTTYYSADGVHMTTAGVLAKAQAIHDAMASFTL